MREWLKKYLEEKHGVNSLIRLQSLITLFFSFGIIIWQMIIGQIHIELDILLITVSFAPKALQKFAEAYMYGDEIKQTNQKQTKDE
jgi:uncharacterized membrane protein YciS (DUF1049 family)